MKKITLILLLLLVPLTAFSQVSSNVPAGDVVYRVVDRLVAAGIIDDVVVGQRPYSRDEIARILIEADENFDRMKRPSDKISVFRLLKYWKGVYRSEISKLKNHTTKKWNVNFLKRLDIDYKYLDRGNRLIPNNGLGSVNAHVSPLTEYSSGRHYANGHNFSFESIHEFGGPYISFYAHPRFQLQIRSGDAEPENRIFVQELYIKTAYKNFEFEVGRDQVVWGQGENAGLIFSDNARALDMIKFSNTHPLKVPFLGYFKGSLLLANMGPHYNRRYAYLTAWKTSLVPARFAEVGFYYGFMMGGDGSPSINAGEVAREFFGFIPRVSNGDDNLSYQVGGFDLRFRVAPLSDLEIYAETYFENPNLSHLDVMFLDKAAYLGGLYLPRLGDYYNMSIRFEYKHTSPMIYRNSYWQSGWALGSEFMGDPLGPDGNRASLSYSYDFGVTSRFIASFAYERRGGDSYTRNRSNGGYIKSVSRPTESRYIGKGVLEHPLGKIVRCKWLFGYESIDNFSFQKNNNRTSLVAGLQLKFLLGL